ncbi:hypothetical protein QWJ34_10780 [Saccharibacillus sp. CPCC 101409]|uniref:hypothetical protein n=1 Tax=Saccharibacillus sp. CPCC 101409 TaxID=3058041 RepID=UPI002672C353|nr:hypothetical protein [Saccharibacillus sp. CPCC 101409]MDO3410245.1 hypothetical protein [Saccharibacillus sp. CPCC 101409]
MSDTSRLIAAIAALAAGLCLFAGHLLGLIAYPAEGSVAGSLFVLAGHTLAVFPLIALAAFLRPGFVSLLGALGCVLSTIGTVLTSAVVYVETAELAGADASPVWAAAPAASIQAFGPLVFVAGLLLLAGCLLAGAWRVRVTGLLLMAGTVLFAAGSVFSAPFTQAIVETIGSGVTAAGFFSGGLLLLSGNSVNYKNGGRLPYTA